jgi:hypothetical protein
MPPTTWLDEIDSAAAVGYDSAIKGVADGNTCAGCCGADSAGVLENGETQAIAAKAKTRNTA